MSDYERLECAPVPRCLDKKLELFGFELGDLLIIFLFFAILNYLFSGLPYHVLLTWVPAIVLALAVRFGKKGKPEGHLIHLIRFSLSPGRLSAFELQRIKPIIKTKDNNNESE